MAGRGRAKGAARAGNSACGALPGVTAWFWSGGCRIKARGHDGRNTTVTKEEWEWEWEWGTKVNSAEVLTRLSVCSAVGYDETGALNNSMMGYQTLDGFNPQLAPAGYAHPGALGGAQGFGYQPMMGAQGGMMQYMGLPAGMQPEAIPQAQAHEQ